MNAQFEGMTLSEKVKVEAMANGYRRETARQVGSTVRGLRGPTAPLFDGSEYIQRVAAELEAEEAAERRSRMKGPNDLIATIKAEWPEDSAAVKAYAEAEGLSLGEAWARVIRKVVGVLRNGDGE